MSFEAAIREFLESFRLPGEAQKIIRILEHWSRQFYAQARAAAENPLQRPASLPRANKMVHLYHVPLNSA